MIKLRRIFAVSAFAVVLFALWSLGMLDGSHVAAQQAGGQKGMDANLAQAASSIVAAAEQGIQQAESEDQLLERLDLSIEALRIVGLLGAPNADDQASKLLDDAQAKASLQAAEVIVRMRLARRLQRWGELSQAEREEAMDRFVADVKASGLTPAHADLTMRLVDNLEMNGHGKIVGKALNELLPLFKSSSVPAIQRRATVVEGMVRRLNLVGQPLELEGTLLDGQPFDWESYRGKVVLVDFFANWCGVCREEVPTVLQAYKAYQGKGFEVVGVSLDKQPRFATMYQQETGFQFPTLFSSNPQAMEWNSPLAVKYGVTSLPRAILVDQQGNVVTTVARGRNLVRYLEKLLGPPANAIGGAGEVEAPSEGGLVVDPNVVPASATEEVEVSTEAEAPAVPE